MSSEKKIQALKEYTILINDIICNVSKLNASLKNLISDSEFGKYQTNTCEFDKIKKKFKSEMNSLKLEFETDILTIGAIKRSLIRLEEKFKILKKNGTKIIDEETHNEIKKIVDRIVRQINKNEENLKRRNNFKNILNKLKKEDLEFPHKDLIANGASLIGGLGVRACYKYATKSEKILEFIRGIEKGKSFLSSETTINITGAILWAFSTWAIKKILNEFFKSLDEKNIKEYEKLVSKLSDFLKSFKKLSEFCSRIPLNLEDVKELCEDIGKDNEYLINFIQDPKILSDLIENIDGCVKSQEKLIELIDEMN